MKTLYDRLETYGNSDFYGMHMPGHKRNRKLIPNRIPYELDITEIDGFDDLHHADGIIREAEARAARLYKAETTHFLVNGSTVGILSAILGSTNRGDKILVARNCHKSVYHAIDLNELEPVYNLSVACGIGNEWRNLRRRSKNFIGEGTRDQSSHDCLSNI